MVHHTIFKSNNMQIRCVTAGILSNNVYVIETAQSSAIVDPSTEPQKLIDMIEDKSPLGKDAQLENIILTHYHFDHIGAANTIRIYYDANVIASQEDEPYITGEKTPPIMHKRVHPCKVYEQVEDGDIIEIGDTEWEVIATPGHSMGSICLYCDNTGVDENGKNYPPILICGDTLFKFSCGRTDFEDSDPDAMRKSLAKLAKLSDNTIVFPGHEEFTTIGHERNYMLKDL